MTAPASPTLHEINAGFEVEWQAGFDTGLAGEPLDPWEHGELFSRYGDTEHGRHQQAAFSRGYSYGSIERSKRRSRQEHDQEQRLRREAQDAAMAWGLEHGYIQPVSA